MLQNSIAQPDEDGPLWPSIRQQFYPSEVPHVKRIVGEMRIRRNRTVWQELVSLRQILGDFQQQNDMLTEGQELRERLVNSPHRNLLEQQVQMLLKDVQKQADYVGKTVLELLPDNPESFRQMCDYFLKRRSSNTLPDRSPSRLSVASGCPTTPSTRPSTRPTSACLSRSSGASEDLPCFATGEPLPQGELQTVATRIGEALEEEHSALLAAIEEQRALLEAEASHQSDTVLRAKAEPSTADLQRLVQQLQAFVTSPGFQALAAVSPTKSGGKSFVARAPAEPAPPAKPAAAAWLGGASVRRLRSLIQQTRLEAASEQEKFAAMLAEEGPASPKPMPPAAPAPAPTCMPGAAGPTAGSSKLLDPFFDDPFLM